MTSELQAVNPEDLWRRLEKASRGTDDHELWVAWKLAHRFRFWKHFKMMGPGQVCAKFGVSYDDILRRLTAYEMKPGRDSKTDEAELIEQGAPPSIR